MTKQERASRTRNALIRSAAQLFEQQGYVRTGLSAISAGAGVSRGALNFHFENKAAMSDAIKSAAARALHRTARQASHEQPDPLQALTDMTHGFAYLLHHDVVVRAGFQLNVDAAQSSGLDLRQEWQGCVQHYVALAAEEKRLVPGVSRESVVTAVVSATVGMEVLSRRNKEWLSRSTLTRFWRQLLSVIATEQARADTAPEGSQALFDQLALLPRQSAPQETSANGTDARVDR
ncbi:MAG: TetR family transcriptional regulator [Streptomyces sp.]|nr:TetR family transcriptional regulator [Streptomyces sp.]